MPEEITARQVVVFTGSLLAPSTVEHIEAVADAFPHWKITVIQERVQPPGQPRRWPFAKRDPAAAVDAAWRRTWRIRRRRGTIGPVGLPDDLSELRRPNVRYLQCRSLADHESFELVRSLQPWLGLAIGIGPLPARIWQLATLGTLTIHKRLEAADCSRRNGLPTQSGVCVHWLNHAGEAVEVLQQNSLEVSDFSTPRGLAPELDLLAGKALLAGLRQIERNPLTRPARGRMLLNGRSLGPFRPRQPAGQVFGKHRGWTWLRNLGKALALAIFLYCWVPLRNAARRRQGRSHVSILLYHGVSDHFLDSVTVGVDQFNRHVNLLARRYRVLDLPQVLAGCNRPRNHSAVAVTFDDGYEQSLLAAMLLRRAGVPCTFFISTQIVGSDRIFPYDQKLAVRRALPLSWDQVRLMAHWGFQISNHTANHCNLGKLDPRESLQEVQSAIHDLQREIGDCAGLRWLAYPYGRPQDITEEVRSQLVNVDVDCCLSAYGGTNPPDFDRLNVLRQGIDHNFSLLAVRGVIEGWPGRRFFGGRPTAPTPASADPIAGRAWQATPPPAEPVEVPDRSIMS